MNFNTIYTPINNDDKNQSNTNNSTNPTQSNGSNQQQFRPLQRFAVKTEGQRSKIYKKTPQQIIDRRIHGTNNHPLGNSNQTNITSSHLLSRYGQSARNIVLHGSSDEYGDMVNFLTELEGIKSDLKRKKWQGGIEDDEEQYYNYYRTSSHDQGMGDDGDGGSSSGDDNDREWDRDYDEKSREFSSSSYSPYQSSSKPNQNRQDLSQTDTTNSNQTDINTNIDNDDPYAYLEYWPSSEDELAISFDTLLHDASHDQEPEMHQIRHQQRVFAEREREKRLERQRIEEKRELILAKRTEIEQQRAQNINQPRYKSNQLTQELQQVHLYPRPLPFMNGNGDGSVDDPAQFGQINQHQQQTQSLFDLGDGIGLWGNDAESKIGHYNQLHWFQNGGHNLSTPFFAPNPPIIAHTNAFQSLVDRFIHETSFTTISGLVQYHLRHFPDLEFFSSSSSLLTATNVSTQQEPHLDQTPIPSGHSATMHPKTIPTKNKINFNNSTSKALPPGKYNPFTLYKTAPFYFNMYSTQPSSTRLLTSAFCSFLLSQLSLLLINSEQLPQTHELTTTPELTNSTQLFYTIPIIGQLFRQHSQQSKVNEAEITTQHSSSHTSTLLSLLNSNPSIILNIISTLRSEITTMIQTTSKLVKLLHFLFTLLHFSGIPLSISYCQIIIMIFLNQLSTGSSAKKHWGLDGPDQQTGSTKITKNAQKTPQTNQPVYFPIPFQTIDQICSGAAELMIETALLQQETLHSRSPSQVTPQLSNKPIPTLTTVIQTQMLQYCLQYSPLLTPSQRKQLQVSKNTITILDEMMNISRSSSPQEDAILLKHQNECLKKKVEGDFFSIFLTSALTSNDLVNNAPMYSIQELIQVLAPQSSDNLENDQEFTDNASPPLNIIHLSAPLPPFMSTKTQHGNFDTNYYQATHAGGDLLAFTPLLPQTIVSTVESKKLTDLAVNTQINNTNYPEGDYNIYDVDLDQPLPLYNETKQNKLPNSPPDQNNNSYHGLITNSGPTNPTMSITTSDLTHLLFPQNLFAPLHQSMGYSTSSNGSKQPITNTPNTHSRDDDIIDGLYHAHNLFDHITDSPSLLGDFLTVVFEKISQNIYSSTIHLFTTLHIYQSLSHLAYIHLSSLPSNIMNRMGAEQEFISGWLRGYLLQYQLFTTKHNLHFSITQVPVDIRFTPQNELTSSRMLHSQGIGDILSSNLITTSPTSPPTLSPHATLMRHYNILAQTLLPPFRLAQHDYHMANKPSPHPSQFYSQIPTLIMQTLISILMTQYQDVYSTHQHDLISPFFGAIELNSIKMENYTLNKRQKTLLSQNVGIPTIQVNIINSLLYATQRQQQIQQSLPLSPSGNPLATNLNNIQPPTARSTEDFHKIAARFSFPKSFPSFSTRIQSRDRILSALEDYSRHVIYPIIFDQREEGSGSTKPETKTDAFNNNPLSNYIHRLNDVLYIRADTVPWLYDISFGDPLLYNLLTKSSPHPFPQQLPLEPSSTNRSGDEDDLYSTTNRSGESTNRQSKSRLGSDQLKTNITTHHDPHDNKLDISHCYNSSWYTHPNDEMFAPLQSAALTASSHRKGSKEHDFVSLLIGDIVSPSTGSALPKNNTNPKKKQNTHNNGNPSTRERFVRRTPGSDSDSTTNDLTSSSSSDNDYDSDSKNNPKENQSKKRNNSRLQDLQPATTTGTRLVTAIDGNRRIIATRPTSTANTTTSSEINTKNSQIIQTFHNLPSQDSQNSLIKTIIQADPASDDINPRLSPNLTNILVRLETHAHKEVDAFIVPINSSYTIGKARNEAYTKLCDNIERIVTTKSVHERSSLIQSARRHEPKYDLMDTVTNPYLGNHLAFYYPGLVLAKLMKINQNNYHHHQETTATETIVGIDEIDFHDNGDLSHDGNPSHNTPGDSPPRLIPYKTYLIYLASLIETLCLLKSMSSPVLSTTSVATSMGGCVLTDCDLIGPTNPHTSVSPYKLMQQSTSTSQYDIYTIPQLFPTLQPFLQSIMNIAPPTRESTREPTTTPGPVTNIQPTSSPSHHNPLLALENRPELMALFNTSTAKANSSSTPRQQSTAIPALTPVNGTIHIPIVLPAHSHSIYRTTLTTFLQSPWSLLLSLTLHNPLHLLSLSPLYYVDGGQAATSTFYSSIQTKAREERKIVEEIGPRMIVDRGDANSNSDANVNNNNNTHIPKCPQCDSNLFIHMLTLSQSITSTKAEIYGSGDGDVVQKYTCQNKAKGCGYQWIVRY